jgi:HK97 family phage portal protein
MGIRAALAALFNSPILKSSVVAPMLVQTGRGQPVWTPRQYDRLAEEGYQKNLTLYRSVSILSRGAAGVPWCLYSGEGDSKKEIEDHPLLDLMRRPNPGQGASEFMEALVAFYMIAGNSYVEKVAAAGKAPKELWVQRPDRIKIVPGNNGLPQEYQYHLGGDKRSWPVDPVTGISPLLHLKMFHPLNDWYGMSPIEAAAADIDQHNSSKAWNVAMLQNAASPSGVLVFSPTEGTQTLTDAQRERIKSELVEGWVGARNAGRPLVLEGAWNWTPTGISPQEMDWLGGLNMTSREIAQSVGVPPMLLGIPGDNTYSNYQEARLALWEETIIPLLVHIKDEFNVWLTPHFGEDLYLEPDFDEIPAIAEKREKKFTMLQGADFLTINEKRRALGYDDVEGGDVILVPGVSVPLEDVLNPPETPTAETTPPPADGEGDGSETDKPKKPAEDDEGDDAQDGGDAEPETDDAAKRLVSIAYGKTIRRRGQPKAV